MAYIRRYLSGQQATTVTIAEKAVTEDKIGDKAVGNAQLGDDAVTSDKIEDSSIESEDIAPGAVESSDIKDGAVITSKIADDAVTADKLADSVLTRPITPGVATTEIADLAVSTAKLAELGVTNAKIGAGAVGATKLAGDAVETDKIKNDAVTAAKIAAGAVGNTEIAADAVRGTEIQNGAVSVGKIGTDAVETVKVKDANITEPKLESDVLLKHLVNKHVFYDDFVGSVLRPDWAIGPNPGGTVVVSDDIVTVTTLGVTGKRKGIGFLDNGGFRAANNPIFVIRGASDAASLTNTGIYLGLWFDDNNYIQFILETTLLGANWFAVTKAGGVPTATDTGIAPVVGSKKFHFEASTGEVKFYIDDVLKATHTTNIPATFLQPNITIEPLEMVVKTLKASMIGISEDGTGV